MTNAADPQLKRLLQETVERYISPSARIAHFVLTPLEGGQSGAALHRCTLSLEQPDTAANVPQLPATITLVCKEACLRERRVLTLLKEQGQPNVPFSHTLDLSGDNPALIVMQDVGDTQRPVSLAPITDEELRQEALGLAAIHSRNSGQQTALAWLPRVDREYVNNYVLNSCWRPAWETAMKNDPLRRLLWPHIRFVEQATETLADDMELLTGESHTQTLVHTDINPSNVLVQNGKPYYIDWQVAHYGSLYLDLPHHFCTRQQAEFYRIALAAQGKTISAADFDDRYRVAARLIGFRYIWWTLADWKEQAEASAWIMHYIDLIKGQL